MTIENKLDLVQHARQTAAATLDAKNDLAVDAAALAAVEEAGINPLDYPDWKKEFAEARTNLGNLRTQPLASTQAAAAAAKAAKTTANS
jgi:antirestriction protein ArdC